MKHLIPLIFIAFLAVNLPVYSQNPFQKNTNFYSFDQNLEFGTLKWKDQDDDESNENYLNWNFEYNYFAWDNIAIGTRIMLNKSVDKYPDNYNYNFNYWMIYLLGTYGITMNNDMNLYAQLGLGFGADKYKFESPFSNSESSDKHFGAYLEIGSPFSLFDSDHFYFTPSFTLNGMNTNYDDAGSEFRASLMLQGRFNIFLGCNEHLCDIRNNWGHSAGKYEQGNMFIGSSYISAGIGTSNTKNDAEPGEPAEETKNSFSSGGINLNGFYYLVDNIAVGLETGVTTSGRTNKDNDNKTNSASLFAMPKVIANLPQDGALNNLFATLGITFGSYKSTFESASIVTYRENDFGVSGGVGYNLFFTDELALNSAIIFEYLKSKEKDEDDFWVYSGPYFKIGLIKHLRF
jgi:hypothetical protein